MARPLRPGDGEVRRLLVVKLSSLGDVVHAIPSAAALATRYPAAEVDWVVEPLAAPLVRALPFVSRTVVFDGRTAFREGGGAFLEAVAGLRESLAGRRYDLAVDLQGLLRSSLVTVLSGAALRLGRGRWPWLHRSVAMYDHRRAPHAVENTARPLASLGIDPLGVYGAGLAAVEPLARDLRARGEALAASLSLPRPFVALLPGASRPSKRLSFGAAALPAPAVVLGGPDARGLGPPGAVDLAGELPLLDAVALALVSDRALGADTGPSHTAALLGASITGVHGPTRVARTGLRGPRARSLGAPCGGCERRRCRRAEACLADALLEAVRSGGPGPPWPREAGTTTARAR